MTEILGVPLKKTSELDLIKPFKNLISLRFSSAENPENFTEAITELQKLRNINAVAWSRSRVDKAVWSG